MKPEDVEFFDKVKSQMGELYKEMTILAKSKPDNPVNKFKLQIVNQRLQEANAILVDSFKPVTQFEVFDEADLPTNSDVVLILSQYLEGLEGWRSANVEYRELDNIWYWKTDGPQKIYSGAPSRFIQDKGERNRD